MLQKGKLYVLDGAMGTMLQRAGLSGDSEAFNISHPSVIKDIHRRYIAAGADIIETNSFGANAISQSEYGAASKAYDFAFAAARLARQAVEESGGKDDAGGDVPSAGQERIEPDTPNRVLVAGSVGPTSKSLSIAVDADRPDFRPLGFDEMAACYGEQIRGLLDGGADFILVETCFDSLNAKAAIYAFEELVGGDKRYSSARIAISASPADRSGHTLTGQSLEAFYVSIRHCNPLFFSINCSLGARQMLPILEQLAPLVHADGCLMGCYPNAGLPDESGNYTQSPREMASLMSEAINKGLVDIVGGCCGTTDAHIAALAALRDADVCREQSEREGSPKNSGRQTRTAETPQIAEGLTLSAQETVKIDKSQNFTNIGERTNVSGSRRFAKLIAAEDYEQALEVAAQQIESGAAVIDINMDDALLDAPLCMRRFVRCLQGDPRCCKAALMIDSSDWAVVLEGLKNAQGKCIVNSISLKEGEEAFLKRAVQAHRLGAAIVVMAFDEKGQATSFERKIEIAGRAYSLLVGAGIPASDIIFDVNVLAVATGDTSDRRYAVDFIEAVRWIKQNLPGALTSGGISNLSFSFRGNNPIREAMHSVFLYHAVKAGLDMAIVNPGMLRVYDDIPEHLRILVEDVILDRGDDAAQALVEYAAAGMGTDCATDAASEPAAAASLEELVLKGSAVGLEEAVEQELKTVADASQLIQGPLMAAMEKVGERFADGRMFLPQVVSSARIMKKTVDILTPLLDGAKDIADVAASSGRPLVVAATVKGDVHDIGKNINATILRCNGFDVMDLGVMVDNETIIAAALEHNADIIAVSGLITPSLGQMEALCRELAARKLDILLMVGGATTSALHTALKLAPLYSHVYYTSDASSCSALARRLIDRREETEKVERERFADIASKVKGRAAGVVSDAGAAAGGKTTQFGQFAPDAKSGQAGGKDPRPLFAWLSADGWAPADALRPNEIPAQAVPVADVAPFIDWKIFFATMGIKAKDYGKAEVEAIKADALKRLPSLPCTIILAAHFEGPLGYFAASVHKTDGGGEQTSTDRCGNLLAHCGDAALHSHCGDAAIHAHCVDAALHHDACPCCSDPVDDSLRLALADAASAYIESRMKLPDGYRFVRPAVGYPSCPDHSLKKDILETIPNSRLLGISLSETWAMLPLASVCGYLIIHKDARYL